MQWQPPRLASLSEMKAAYRAGNPISQDFRFENAQVYFAAFGGLGMIKIGVSNDVAQRLQNIAKSEKCEGSLLLAIAGNRQIEAEQHRRFGKWRVRGEWFRDCEEVRSLIAATRAGAR
jgi:hypothetical protein